MLYRHWARVVLESGPQPDVAITSLPARANNRHPIYFQRPPPLLLSFSLSKCQNRANTHVERNKKLRDSTNKAASLPFLFLSPWFLALFWCLFCVRSFFLTLSLPLSSTPLASFLVSLSLSLYLPSPLVPVLSLPLCPYLCVLRLSFQSSSCVSLLVVLMRCYLLHEK